MLDRAHNAYERALKKDQQNLQALWGSAQVAASQKRYADVREFTRLVLDKDAQYKFGDVSLAHVKALNELGDFETALTHLEQHVRRWRHPEAVYLLAKLHLNHGDPTIARQQLVGLIQDIDGSPTAIARRHGRWKSRARQMLRRLPN
jgi:lipopolysaccharide biosynthesis regulator YciM